VDWIHHALLAGQRTKLLDLGCGPGLYTSRLARLGHECTGIDFSPASIVYAKEQAQAARLSCRYIQGDIRAVDYGTGYGLVMLIFGEFNVFHPSDAEAVLRQACQALDETGMLLLEAHTFAAVQQTSYATGFRESCALEPDFPLSQVRPDDALGQKYSRLSAAKRPEPGFLWCEDAQRRWLRLA
jgi:SAM-dependent methyltransferase